jgi:23S rRNA pseudouridine1911/1915/1917 synthase
MPEKKEFYVSEEEAGIRLDLFLVHRIPEHSRTRLKALIEEGGVLVNMERLKPRHPVASGDRVEVLIPPAPPESPTPEPISLDILYEDNAIIVINKPPGLTVHPVRAGQGGTLVNALLHHCDILSDGGGILRPGIVHRLDRYTTGVMIAAKDNRSHDRLVSQFKDRTVGKEYLAVVWGIPPLNYGRLTYPIGRSERNRIRMAVKYADGRKAHTEYEVIERFTNCAYLRLVIKTGRTHQIRVHLSRFGYPVLGDREYGSRGAEESRRLNISRQMLHAHRLRIAHPVTGEQMEFTAPIPADMKDLLNKLKAN